MKKLLIGIVAIALLIIVGSMLLPAEVVVQRTVQIHAPVDLVYNQVNNLKAWEAWDPWHAREPEMGGSVYTGPEEGEGATHCWDSEHPEIGKGCMIITESQASSYINTALQFDGMDSAFGGFKFNESDGMTAVTWSMEMNMGMNPIGRIMGMFMDGILGPDFENGLANLKKVTETMPAGEPEEEKEYAIPIEMVDIEELHYYSIKDSATTFEIEEKLAEMYEEIEAYIVETGAEKAGPQLSIWHKYDPAHLHHAEAAIPVVHADEGKGRIQDGFIPAGNVVRGVHIGHYQNASVSYHALEDYMIDNGLHENGPPWEVYITDRKSEPDTTQWVTHIFYRVH